MRSTCNLPGLRQRALARQALMLPDPQDLAPWRQAAARHGLHLLPG